jgi:SMI1/KNR4 family protein SUKH-1
MAEPLSASLVERLRERAQDPALRSGSGALAAGSTDLGAALQRSMAPDPSWSPEVRSGVEEYVAGIDSPFAAMTRNLLSGDGSQARGLLDALGALTGGQQLFAMDGQMGGQGVLSTGAPAGATQAPAAPPATEEGVAAAEAELGLPLPAPLRQLYLEIADGGFGPGDGLYSLSELVAKHRELTGEPVGPQGQPWPGNLLAVQGQDWEVVALDLESGRLVLWDLEELDDDDELPPDQPTWAASFVPEADSLAAWLESWAG